MTDTSLLYESNVTIRSLYRFGGRAHAPRRTLAPMAPATLYGVRKIYPGGYVQVNYDGNTFWSEGPQIATDSTLGVVQPDNVTVAVDSTDGVLYTMVSVGSGAPSGTPNTPGNPFYFDSTVSPWNGYVYALGGWNRFS